MASLRCRCSLYRHQHHHRGGIDDGVLLQVALLTGDERRQQGLQVLLPLEAVGIRVGS